MHPPPRCRRGVGPSKKQQTAGKQLGLTNLAKNRRWFVVAASILVLDSRSHGRAINEKGLPANIVEPCRAVRAIDK